LKFWDDRRDGYLRILAQTHSLKDAAVEFGKPAALLCERAKKLGIEFAVKLRRPWPKWTREEDLKIFHMAEKYSVKQIARALRRTPWAVKRRAGRLKIRLRAGETVTDVASYIGVAESSVRFHRDKLGQNWGKRSYPRGPETEEIQAIALALLESPKPLRCDLRRLARIARGLE
jgi:hypothetical protein